jgi:LPXTG-motif cell wall-anchored protein
MKKSFNIGTLFKQFEKLYKDIKSQNLSKRQSVMMITGLVFILLFLSGGVYYTIRIFTRAQTCFTTAQVASDSRCLYIYNNQVFEKGTRAAPHHDNPCGTDVTALIPNTHLIDKIGHLDPNYQGNICANNPVPTAQPTSAPPTNTPQPQATAIPPTQTSSNTNTTQPTATRTPSPTTVSSQSTNTETLTDTPAITTNDLSPTISALPKTGATEDVIAAVSAGLLIIGALGLIF